MPSTDRRIGLAYFIGVMLASISVLGDEWVLKKLRVAAGTSEEARTRVKSSERENSGRIFPNEADS
jgi:hypothetical protein